MQIRRLTVDDYEAIVSLWFRAGLPYKPGGRDSKASVAQQIMTNPDFFIGAFENGRLVGTVVLSSDMRKGWINRLAIDPDRRRQGLAKTLIEESEKTLRSHGLKIFCSLIEGPNKASRALFKKCGYAEHSDISYFSKRDDDTV
jgi:ribosomal protein S18 acetylase RimI-like enzyme